MEQLKKILESSEQLTLSNDEVIGLFDWIGKRGDVILLKNDGLRDMNKFTVVIIRPEGTIRYDGETLSAALLRSLKEYNKLIAKE